MYFKINDIAVILFYFYINIVVCLVSLCETMHHSSDVFHLSVQQLLYFGPYSRKTPLSILFFLTHIVEIIYSIYIYTVIIFIYI